MTNDSNTESQVFDWTNEQWATRWLPYVRLASVALLPDREEAVGEMNEDEAATLAESFVDAAAHLKALSDLCAAAAAHVADTWDAARPNSA